MTSSAKLTAPPHLHGPILGSSPTAIQRRQERAVFVRQAAAAGYSITAVAAALGVSRASFARDHYSLFAARRDDPPPQPDQILPAPDRLTLVIGSGGQHNDDNARRISLPAGPGVECRVIALAPRPETAPRGSHMIGQRVERRMQITVDEAIEIIRSCRDQHLKDQRA